MPNMLVNIAETLSFIIIFSNDPGIKGMGAFENLAFNRKLKTDESGKTMNYQEYAKALPTGFIK